MYCHNFYPPLLTKVITHSMNYKYFAVLQVYIIKQIKYILTTDEFFLIMILTTNKYTLKTDEFFLSYHDFGYEINFCELNNCDVSNKFEKNAKITRMV